MYWKCQQYEDSITLKKFVHQCQGRKLVNSGQNLVNVVKEQPPKSMIQRCTHFKVSRDHDQFIEIQITQHECNA